MAGIGPFFKIKILPVAVYGRGVIHFVWSLCVSLSMLQKTMNNFWTDGPIWTKFSGVACLVTSNIWLGSTTAQSPLSRPWPASRPFPWNLADPWFLGLLGLVMPFWKGFDQANKNVRGDFWFWAWIRICGCQRGLEGSQSIFVNEPLRASFSFIFVVFKHFYTINVVDFSGIQTRIVGEDGTLTTWPPPRPMMPNILGTTIYGLCFFTCFFSIN